MRSPRELRAIESRLRDLGRDSVLEPGQVERAVRQLREFWRCVRRGNRRRCELAIRKLLEVFADWRPR